MIRRAYSSLICSQHARFFRVIPMPALSPTMETGKIISWGKKVGEKVSVGDSYCKLETDKATVSFDNTDDEVILARIVADSGITVKVGDPVCLVVDEESELSNDEIKNWKPASSAAASTSSDAAPAATATAGTAASAPTATTSGDRIFASPLAKKTARELGVDLASCVGTGGAVGRITKSDVERALANPKPVATTPPAAASAASAKSTVSPVTPAGGAGDLFEDVPLSGMRSTIARRLTQSKNIEVPHYYLMGEARADNMLATIKALNAKGAGDFKITVNDFLVKAMARANLLVPACNSQWGDGFIRTFKTVDVAVAVATPSGLITPIIRNAHVKGLAQISQETKELAKRGRDGALSPEEYQGGTVTISNLGGFGIQNFTAIINQPHSMILAVGGISPKPEIAMNEQTQEYELTGKVQKVIAYTASLDHRIVDGAVGAEWMKHFKDAVENPLSLLL